MNRIKHSLRPSIAKLIKENYPVVKNRTALWFFTREVKDFTSKQQDGHIENLPKDKTNKKVEIKHQKILEIWHKMNPEAKRKYYNMAEFDEVRYKEQKSRWLTEVGQLLVKFSGSKPSEMFDVVSTSEQLDREFIEASEKFKSNYEHMIQIESTKTLYRDLIKQNNQHVSDADGLALIEAVPHDYRRILSRPRRPAGPFVMYLRDNKTRLIQMMKEEKLPSPISRAAAIEWSSLDAESKVVYEHRYQKLVDEYLRAMKEFKESSCGDDDLEQASREKKAFKKSLRRRLKNSYLLPKSIRNAFNFFVQEHKGMTVKECTQLWKAMTEEEKSRYKEMSNADATRYEVERNNFVDLITSIESILNSKDDETGR